jgi:hypothetical protein
VGVLDDMLSDAGAEPAPASTFGDVVARAVGGKGARRDAAAPPSLDPLLALDDGALRRLIRYLPAEAVVPLLARASVPVATRVVGLLDAESQAWLAAQSDAIEACTVEAHADAARQALALIPRAQAAGPVAAPAPPAPRRPVQVSTSFSGEAVAATPPVPAPAPVPVPAPAAPVQAPSAAEADDVVETLAALVALAAGRNPAQLNELAAAVDHPVLAEGLRAAARGADGHAIDETVRIAGNRWIEDQTRRVELMRLALLAIRFGDGPDRFRAATRPHPGRTT